MGSAAVRNPNAAVVDLGLLDCVPAGEGRAHSVANRTLAVVLENDD